MKNQDEMGLHEHEFHELVVVFGGTGMHFSEDEEYEINTGDVFLVSPGNAHGYRDTHKLDLVNILYLPERFQISPMDLINLPGYHALFELEPKMRRQHNFKSRLTLDAEDLEKVKTLIALIQQEMASSIPGKHYMAFSFFMQLQCFIARNYSEIKSAEGKTIIGIADLITFMGHNLKKQITLDDLARKANMSKSSLHRNFIHATGESPIRYLIRMRVKKAADILRSGRENVSETAFAVGFNDSNYFVRQFRQVMGITPNKYKNRDI